MITLKKVAKLRKGVRDVPWAVEEWIKMPEAIAEILDTPEALWKENAELKAELLRYKNAQPGYYKDSDIAKLEAVARAAEDLRNGGPCLPLSEALAALREEK